MAKFHVMILSEGSSSTHAWKVISKVKVSDRITEGQNYRISDLKNDKEDENNIPPPRSSISGAYKCMDEIFKKNI